MISEKAVPLGTIVQVSAVSDLATPSESTRTSRTNSLVFSGSSSTSSPESDVQEGYFASRRSPQAYARSPRSFEIQAEERELPAQVSQVFIRRKLPLIRIRVRKGYQDTRPAIERLCSFWTLY